MSWIPLAEQRPLGKGVVWATIIGPWPGAKPTAVLARACPRFTDLTVTWRDVRSRRRIDRRGVRVTHWSPVTAPEPPGVEP